MKEIIREYTGTAVGLAGMLCFVLGIGNLFFSPTGFFAMLIQRVIGGIG